MNDVIDPKDFPMLHFAEDDEGNVVEFEIVEIEGSGDWLDDELIPIGFTNIPQG